MAVVVALAWQHSSGSNAATVDDVNNDNNDNNGTMTMRWRRRGWNNDDLMMGLRVLCHPSEATINSCRQFGEESTRERN
jgi:hypothetical protein